jgi:hypothetical protein
VTQKATNLGVATGVIKADVPPEPKSEDVGKGDLETLATGDAETLAGGDPESLASGDISAARQAVENIKPGVSIYVLSFVYRVVYCCHFQSLSTSSRQTTPPCPRRRCKDSNPVNMPVA